MEPQTPILVTADWQRERKRWVFLTSSAGYREKILPLHSVWLDLLILRMQGGCEDKNAKPVWFVLDELATLNKLPQLHTAVTENRKYGNPVVLGFQGRSQLEKRYGKDAEAMLSQPATKVFFQTSEPRAAKWISEAIGDIEVERLKESRSMGLLGSKNRTRWRLRPSRSLCRPRSPVSSRCTVLSSRRIASCRSSYSLRRSAPNSRSLSSARGRRSRISRRSICSQRRHPYARSSSLQRQSRARFRLPTRQPQPSLKRRSSGMSPRGLTDWSDRDEKQPLCERLFSSKVNGASTNAWPIAETCRPS